MSSGTEQAERLENAVGGFAQRIRAVEPALLQQEPKPGEWNLKQLTAHSAEIYGYWAKQIVWLRVHAGQPFGRTAADKDRIRFIDEHHTDSLEALLGTMEQGAAEAAAALRSYSPAEWESVTGIHAARGEMHMDFISDLFLAGHAEEHLRQLDETLAALGVRIGGA